MKTYRINVDIDLEAKDEIDAAEKMWEALSYLSTRRLVAPSSQVQRVEGEVLG